MKISSISRKIRRIREIGSELDYAQRRAMEIRTGLSLGAKDSRPRRARMAG